MRTARTWSRSPGASSVNGLSFAPDGESLVDRRPSRRRNARRGPPGRPGSALTVLDIRLPRAWEGSDHPTFRPTNPQEILVVAQPEPGDPSGAYPRGIYVYDLGTGGIRTIVEPVYDRYVQDVAWLPDGEHIIYSSRALTPASSRRTDQVTSLRRLAWASQRVVQRRDPDRRRTWRRGPADFSVGDRPDQWGRGARRAGLRPWDEDRVRIGTGAGRRTI